MNARDLGYQAYTDGDSIDDNPYKYGSADWNDWVEGFQQAEEEDA